MTTVNSTGIIQSNATHYRENKMTYNTYIVSIVVGDSLRFFEIVACDKAAAHADVRATYGEDVQIVSTGVK